MLATIIDIMVAIDAFVASLAGLNLVARTLYAMGRDRGLPSVFGWTHPRYKSPWVGIVTGLLLTLVLGATLPTGYATSEPGGGKALKNEQKRQKCG